MKTTSQYKEYKETKYSNCNACNFYQHAFCAAPIIYTYDWEDTEICPRACEVHGYTPSSIQVKNLDEKIKFSH